MVELKAQAYSGTIENRTCFNRSMVELKGRPVEPGWIRYVSFNRSMVELKASMLLMPVM